MTVLHLEWDDDTIADVTAALDKAAQDVRVELMAAPHVDLSSESARMAFGKIDRLTRARDAIQSHAPVKEEK